jgi:hypothetical protein
MRFPYYFFFLKSFLFLCRFLLISLTTVDFLILRIYLIYLPLHNQFLHHHNISNAPSKLVLQCRQTLQS